MNGRVRVAHAFAGVGLRAQAAVSQGASARRRGGRLMRGVHHSPPAAAVVVGDSEQQQQQQRQAVHHRRDYRLCPHRATATVKLPLHRR